MHKLFFERALTPMGWREHVVEGVDERRDLSKVRRRRWVDGSP